jgi:hypothetical protein
LDAGKAAKGWQTSSWSGNNKDPRISLYQYAFGQTIAGGTCDIDDGYSNDLGQWSASPVNSAPPTISSVSPNPITADAADGYQTLTINGANFVATPTITLT